MFGLKISGNERSKKEKFDTFLLFYFIIILTLSIFFLKKGSAIEGFLVFGWILFVVFLLIERFLIVKIVSNRLSRKLKVYSHKHGLDSEFDNSIIVQYGPPKGINAAEAGLLLHCYASSIDMFSLLYLWSSKKLINITTEEREGKECIILSKIENLPNDIPDYQSKFFNNLFRGSNELFLTEFSEIDNYYDTFDLEKYGVNQGWFENDYLVGFRYTSRAKMVVAYLVALLVGLFFGTNFAILLVVLLYIGKRSFQWFYKLKRTEKGNELVEHLLGFRKFVLSCDEKKFESFLNENPLYYDEILSYAVVFGVETDLMKKLIPVLDEDIDPGDGTYGTRKSIGKFKK